MGGWFLAGKSLRPVRLAFDRQHAFVADASHELRTPLAVISANAEFLTRSSPRTPRPREIVRETDRLSGLVDCAAGARPRRRRGAAGSTGAVDLAG